MSEDDTYLRLTRRRALGGIATIGAAGATLGAGTSAYFSDEVDSENNTIEAGDIDLTTNGNDNPTATIDVGPVAPGQSGSQSLGLNNTGSINGNLSLVFGTPENDNDLIEVLEITVKIDGTVVRRGTFDSVFDGEGEWSNADFPLAGGSSKPLEIEWAVSAGAGNDVQNEVAEGDITIQLNQQEEAFADLVVDPDSSEGNVSSIQEGVDDAPEGGVVLVRNGTYNEAVTVDKADLTIAAKNSGGATLETAAQNHDNKAIRINGVSGVTIDGLDVTFTSQTATNGEKYAVRALAESDDLTVRNCSIGGFSATDASTNDGAVRATGVTVTETQGPDAGKAVNNPIIENNVFQDIKTTGGTDSSDTDNDSKAKGVALNGDVREAAVVRNDFLDIGAASGSAESPATAEFVTESNVNGTAKPRGLSMVENSSSVGPTNFTVLDNTFNRIVGTFGQPAIFVGGSSGLGSDHGVYDNEFYHPVDNLSSGVLRLRNNTWEDDEDDDGVPELLQVPSGSGDPEVDGGNLIKRGGGSYDTTYTLQDLT